MDALTTTQGAVALTGAVLGLMSLVVCVILARRLRRLQAAQRVVLGETGARDLALHAEQLEREFGALSAGMSEVAERLDRRMDTAERRLDGAIAHHALVRYDAYNELSGRQSMSIALLDAERSGIVISSIHHRDQARLYAKQVHAGRGELELSPEEAEAIRIAVGGGRTAEPGGRTAEPGDEPETSAG